MRIDGWKLAALILTTVGLSLTVLTLITSISFRLGSLDNMVRQNMIGLARIQETIDDGRICRSCASSSAASQILSTK